MKHLFWLAAFLFFHQISMAQYLPLYHHIPNYTATTNEESTSYNNAGILIISKVSRPAYRYYRVKKDTVQRPCVIICPGGGYSVLAAGHEGSDVALFLNSIGINALVVKYRIPDKKNQPDPAIAPLQDLQQAMYLARLNANAWGILSDKIGVLGFSAGGHLAASLSSHYMDLKINNPEHISLRPDFQVLLYPVISFQAFGHKGSSDNMVGSDASAEQLRYFSNEQWVNSQTPPAFIIHAKDDSTVPVQNALVYHEALQQNKVSSFLHLFEKGGHGFGMMNKQSETQWPELLKQWMLNIRLIER
ncbi:MAG TPA: alpha/beta hydrolase [Sediminibacterium sp.]|nr:alpha/beta hydrolase [Sediminibacterium sp.]